MSAILPSAPAQKMTAPRFKARKGGEPLVCLTAYTHPMARLLDPVCDMLLVGDSLGMVVHGFDSTVPVSLDLMILHAQAVMRGADKALVVVDLPFGSYEDNPSQAFHSAAQILKASGAPAVKLEGGCEQAATVRFLTERGIPVMGHVGLRPQSVHALGGYAAQGRREQEWAPILEDAHCIAEAGAFALVVEGVAEPLAAEITAKSPVPVIGIGASARCDGQILVTDDMLGLFPWNPKFVKRYAELADAISTAAGRYADEVRARSFPGADQTYGMKR